MKIREIKQYGNTIAIKLSPSDLVDLKLKVGDLVDIEDIVVINKKEVIKKWEQWNL